MRLHCWKDVPVEVLSDTVKRQAIHTDQVTMARLFISAGGIIPRHNHINEQISTVESGSLRFIFDDAEVVVHEGESLQIPPNLAHRVEALEDSVAFDLFSPVREDWRNGDDAYLRGR